MLGIVEEICEFRNLIKWEQDQDKINTLLLVQHAEVEDEIGDIYWFLAILANKTDVDMDSAISKVIESNQKRFPIKHTINKHTNIYFGGHDGRNNK